MYLDSISERELAALKQQTTVAPKVLTEYDFGNDLSFPTYRISDTRIYIPKYYGIKHYGPTKNLIKHGQPIDTQFEGTLKPHQTDFCNQILNQLKTNHSCMAVSQTGSGKCEKIDTPHLMYDGTIKLVQNLQIGDLLMGDDSTPRTVLSLARGRDTLYDIVTFRNDSFTVNADHILCLKYVTDPTTVHEISVRNFLSLPPTLQYKFKLYKVPVLFQYKPVILDPYIIGDQIGTNLYTNDEIPSLYKINCTEVRLLVLVGILVATGHIGKIPGIAKIGELTHVGEIGGVSEITNLGEILGNIQYEIPDPLTPLTGDIIFLARSLGLDAYKIGRESRSRIVIQWTEHRLHNFIIARSNPDDYYGFELSGNGRYVLGDFTVSHNTTMALWLVSQLRNKTLIIVHKSFLMDQWKERIEQFLPMAKIGIIKQNKCEIDGTDVTIGMMQTMLKRDCPTDTFGLTIFDECLTGDQMITTTHGLYNMSRLYYIWKNEFRTEILPAVLSYSHITNKFEYKAVTYAWERSSEGKILTIHYKNEDRQGSIKCTGNHLILTPAGYKPAETLAVGDLVSCTFSQSPPYNRKGYYPGCSNSHNLITGKERSWDHNNLTALKIYNIVKTPYAKKLYDIEVEDNNNFVLENGLVVHNCHHLGAQGFSNIFFKVGTHYTLGLTATPTRTDGLAKIFNWFLGQTIKNEVCSEIELPLVRIVDCFYENKITPKFNYKGSLNNADLVNQLVMDSTRNSQIIGEIASLHNSGRKILVLSGRRSHCEYLAKQLNREGISTGLYLGGMPIEDLTISNEKPVILGTYNMVSEAYDNPELDTLVLATGMGNVQQAVGRIIRRKNKFRPLVVDFTDTEFLSGQARRRMQFYKRSGFEWEDSVSNLYKVDNTCDIQEICLFE